MTELLTKLMNGDHSVVDAFVAVKQKWHDLLQNFDWNADNASTQIAHLAGLNQLKFEEIVGDTWLGQQIMVLVGFGQFYSVTEGFTEENLRKVMIMREGFLKSTCSGETHSYTNEATELFYLEIEEVENEEH